MNISPEKDPIANEDATRIIERRDTPQPQVPQVPQVLQVPQAAALASHLDSSPADRTHNGSNDIGWYGKLPAAGDFLTRRLPESFRQPWDAWLCAGMVDAKATVGEFWQDVFLSFPVWRFLARCDSKEPRLWAGLLLPGVDRVGRLFPFTVALSVQAETLMQRSCVVLDQHLDSVQALTLKLLEDDNIGAFDDALCALRSWSNDVDVSTFANPPAPKVGAVHDSFNAAQWFGALGLQQWLSTAASTVFWTTDDANADTLRVATWPPRAEDFTAIVTRHFAADDVNL